MIFNYEDFENIRVFSEYYQYTVTLPLVLKTNYMQWFFNLEKNYLNLICTDERILGPKGVREEWEIVLINKEHSFNTSMKLTTLSVFEFPKHKAR